MSEEPEIAQEADSKVKPSKTSLLRNYISFAGFAIAASSLTCILLLILIELTGSSGDNPYRDLITFIFFPSILGFGLFVVLVGALLERRRRRRSGAVEIPTFPVLDLNDPRRRRSFLIFLCLAFAFLFMSAFGSYRAFEYTESVTFCGQACHSVMNPEFTAYRASPHSQVKCVDCHVGSGAHGYVQSKFNGMRQLYGVVTGHYSKPIETPVRNLPDTTETCQHCHWSQKYNGDELRVFNHYDFDETNSLNQTRMLVKVGGGDPNAGPVGGIHWHMSVNNEVTYIASDDKRQVIPWVRVKRGNGQIVEYLAKEASLTSTQIEQSAKRTMNCVDCHNRPTHIYLSPNQAVDQAFDATKLDLSLPYLKARAVETLSKPYSTNDEAVNTIAGDIDGYYKASYPDVYASKRESISGAISELQRIYQTYFFPEMKADWQAHSNNIGHYNSQGCFRCHDGQHFSRDGQVIRNDCAVCHVTIDQTFKGKTIVDQDGVFQHPVKLGDKATKQCAECHKGDRDFKHPLNLGDISQFHCVECHKGQSIKMPGF